MNVVAFSGSPRKDGNTSLALSRVLDVLEDEGISTELVQLANKRIRGCTACMKCAETRDGTCSGIKDFVSEACIPKALEADGIIIGSPVYFADVTAETKALIDRLGYASRHSGNLLARKVGAAVAVNRRAGALNALDTINHLFLINEMVAVGSGYWPMAVGRNIGEVADDEEGMRTMETLGHTMAWALRGLRS